VASGARHGPHPARGMHGRRREEGETKRRGSAPRHRVAHPRAPSTTRKLMNLNTAVLLPWILAPLLILGVAWYAIRAVREQQRRADVLERELAVREDALEHLAASTLPALSESVRRFEQTAVGPEVPPGLENSRFAQCLRWILDRVSEDLRTVQSETRETVT